ncbi:peptidylprolyl isomerase [Candidatus Pacearchaeota archaeon]|jgi:FKBP-type peptidyl-prolyl cis-trans isomerase 2|nr:peptidylprolyl isomerase [Candidatus Pacearchaeota archaeon]
MTFQKKDFIEIEFTGKVKDGGIFDSNIKEDLEKLNPEAKPKPFVFCLGEGMFLKGIDEFLIGKEIGKYNIELSPEKAFGPRVPSFIQMVPMKIFQNQNVRPYPGAVFNFDGRIAKILSVSGGRVTADFNHPLAGKNLVYEIKVLRQVENLDEKLKSFIEFIFRRELKFSVEGKKLIIEVEKELAKFVEMFKDKFKEIFDLDLEVKEITPSPKAQQ